MSVIEKVGIGDTAPDFELINPANGDRIRLSDKRGKNVLLVFLRGTWCPFCKEQLNTLREAQDRLIAAGINTIAISCQTRASVTRYLTQNPLPFSLLADEKREVARAFSVHYWLSMKGVNLANPAIFIVDTQGKVSFRYVGKNMSDLPVSTILEKFISFLQENK